MSHNIYRMTFFTPRELQDSYISATDKAQAEEKSGVVCPKKEARVHKPWCKKHGQGVRTGETEQVAQPPPEVTKSQADPEDIESKFLAAVSTAIRNEEVALWTCPGHPETKKNAGRIHYAVPMRVAGEGVMGCIFCKQDLLFLPAVNIPKGPGYYYHC